MLQIAKSLNRDQIINKKIKNISTKRTSIRKMAFGTLFEKKRTINKKSELISKKIYEASVVNAKV